MKELPELKELKIHERRRYSVNGVKDFHLKMAQDKARTWP